MNVRVPSPRARRAAIRIALRRPPRFAQERVGFISTGLSAAGEDLLVLARAYRSVRDEDYLHDPTVGAMMGPEAIRKALQWAMQSSDGISRASRSWG